MNSFGRKGFYQSQEFGMADSFRYAGYDTDVYRCVTKDPHDEDHAYYNKVLKFGTHALFDPDRFFRKKYDVIIAFCDTQLLVPRLARYCRRNGTIFVPYVGVTESVAFTKKIKKRVMDIVFRFTTLRTYRKCDHIFCKNRAVMHSLEDFGIPSKNLVFSPVGINTQMLNDEYKHEDRIKIREDLEYAECDRVILFVGRLITEKRPLDLFKILDKIDADGNSMVNRLLIIGDGFMADEVAKRASNYGDRVRLLRQVPYDEMWKYYAAADCFVNLWDREVFGMAVVEAIYYMTPTFLIRAPGPEVISEGMENSYLCDTVDEIAEAICEHVSYDADSLYHDKERLINKLSWDKFVNDLESVIWSDTLNIADN